jgi:O-antigen ligase
MRKSFFIALTFLSMICIYGFVLTLGFSYEINRIFLAGVYGIFLINTFTNHQNLSEEYRWKLLPLLLFLLFILSGLFFTADYREGFKFLEKNLAILILPLLWPARDSTTGNVLMRKRIEQLFIGSMLVAGLVCLVYATHNSIEITGGKIIFDSRILKDPRIDFQESITWGGNYFFSDGLSPFIHPSYFSLYLTLAFFILLQWKLRIYRNFIFGLFLALFFVVLIFLLSSKAGYFTMLAGAFLFMFMRLKENRPRKITVIALTTILAASVLLFITNPRFGDLVNKLNTQGFELDADGIYSYESRLLTWSSALGLIKEHPVEGVGVGDVENELLKYYQKKGYATPLERQYNAHNQYLETWLGAGVTGILVLLMMLGRSFLNFYKRGDIIPSLFVMMISIHFLFESMLDRYAGIVFFMFFYCLYHAQEKNTREEKLVSN